jgi:pyruvate/2-oxoglutarate dehydrogenase complex dihydrolipoamide acyltransferase (E2) component
MRRYAFILAAALALPISIEPAEARLDILVDKATQRMLVIQNGYMRYIWPVSTGRDELATPSGVYAPQRLERNWFSTAYYNSPMPYSIFFHNGYAIHGSYAINQLGGPASHGCVRLHPHHAALLFDLVQQEGPDKTTIEVTDEARPDEPPLPGREIAAGQGQYPPEPRIVRYRETGDMPESPLARRANRSLAVRAAVPRRPVPAGGRRAQPDMVAEGSGREPGREPSREQAQPTPAVPPRPAPVGGRRAQPDVVAEGSSREVAREPLREQAQPTPAVYGFKVLPASCWSGGASRWRWWTSSQGASCK